MPYDCYVRAVMVMEPFLYETVHGWVEGHAGMWLVDLGNDVRFAVHDNGFKVLYELAPTGPDLRPVSP